MFKPKVAFFSKLLAALLLYGLDHLSHGTRPILDPSWGEAFFSSAPYFVFMFIGIGFNNLFCGAWSPRFFGLMTGFFLLVFYIGVAEIGHYHWELRIYRGYSLMLVVFAFCYWYRDHLNPHPGLNFFAEISYPLYVIHAIAGYVLMSFLYHYQHLSLLVFLETLTIIIPLAYLLHVYVEMPMNNLGHRLTSSK